MKIHDFLQTFPPLNRISSIFSCEPRMTRIRPYLWKPSMETLSFAVRGPPVFKRAHMVDLGALDMSIFIEISRFA